MTGWIDRALLSQHYDKILSDNKDRILSGGTGDGLLVDAGEDRRMALAILIRISPDIKKKIQDCIAELRVIEPDLYFYPEHDLHITVMDVLRGEEGRRIPENIAQYIHCIEECCRDISPFTIIFDGLTASDNAIMVRGFYDVELLRFREHLRNAFAETGLKLEERYKTISSHITITRLPKRYHDPEALMDYVTKPRFFGSMAVDSMEVTFHNWYDTKKSVLSKIYL